MLPKRQRRLLAHNSAESADEARRGGLGELCARRRRFGSFDRQRTLNEPPKVLLNALPAL